MYPDIPDGMSIKDFTNHPVRQLLRHAAYSGHLPSPVELDALRLPAQLRDRVRTNCRDIAAIHDEGEHQVAWGLGDDHACQVLEQLGEEQRDPRFYAPASDPIDLLGPSELAALVRR